MSAPLEDKGHFPLSLENQFANGINYRHGVQKYGTILVDLEHRHVVDLLADREKTTVTAWLTAHSGVKLISRDRGGVYAEAAREAAPLATQVADRFHLSQNLGETLEGSVAKTLGGARWEEASFLAQLRLALQTGWR